MNQTKSKNKNSILSYYYWLYDNILLKKKEERCAKTRLRRIKKHAVYFAYRHRSIEKVRWPNCLSYLTALACRCRSCLPSSGSTERRWNDAVDRPPPNCFSPASRFLTRAAVVARGGAGRDGSSPGSTRSCWTRRSRCRRRRRVLLGRPLDTVRSNCRSIGGNSGVGEGCRRRRCRSRSRREGLSYDRTGFHDFPPSSLGPALDRRHRCSTYLLIDFFSLFFTCFLLLSSLLRFNFGRGILLEDIFFF